MKCLKWDCYCAQDRDCYWKNIILHGWEDHDSRIGYEQWFFIIKIHLLAHTYPWLSSWSLLLSFLFPFSLSAEKYYCYFRSSSTELPSTRLHELFPQPRLSLEHPTEPGTLTVTQGQSGPSSPPWQRASPFPQHTSVGCNWIPSPPAWSKLAGEQHKAGDNAEMCSQRDLLLSAW